MSAVMRPSASDKTSEQAFFESQKLPPDKRGVTFEVLFYRQLQQVTARIHETENIEQIMLEVSQDICKLLNADRLTLYAVNEDQSAIVSKLKTGLSTSRELKLPISPQSLAGYVAYSRKMLNLADVYDDEALKQIHPALTFLKEVDKRSGYRTKQMLVAPIMEGASLHGVLQVINNKSDQTFGELEVEGVAQLCKTLGTAIRQRMQKSDEGQRRKTTKYDGLVADGVLTDEELRQCIQEAREQGVSVEHLLTAKYQIQPAQIGPSLAKFFGVPYEPFNAGRIRSEPRPLIRCWPTCRPHRWTTKAAMTTRWSRRRPTTSWSSSSTRSSLTPITRKPRISTLSRCRASSRPASASALMAR